MSLTLPHKSYCFTAQVPVLTFTLQKHTLLFPEDHMSRSIFLCLGHIQAGFQWSRNYLHLLVLVLHYLNVLGDRLYSYSISLIEVEKQDAATAHTTNSTVEMLKQVFIAHISWRYVTSQIFRAAVA